MILLRVALSSVLLLAATSALAQSSAEEEAELISGASHSMTEAFRRGDDFEGRSHCLALKRYLKDLRWHTYEQYRGHFDDVERLCGVEISQPEIPSVSNHGRAPLAPADLPPDLRQYWAIFDRIEEMQSEAVMLPNGNATRKSLAADMASFCGSTARLYPNAGHGTAAMVLWCQGSATLLAGDISGCAYMRDAVSALRAPEATGGVFADRVKRYRENAEHTLSLCGG